MDVRSTLATQMDPSKDHSLIVRPVGEASLRTNPDGVMARMTRGVLTGVGADRTLAAETRFRLGEYEFREADYRQIRFWANALGLSSEVVLERMMSGRCGDRDEDIAFGVEDGAIVSLALDFLKLPITSFEWQPGLQIKRLAFTHQHPVGPVQLAVNLPSLNEFCFDYTGALVINLGLLPRLTNLSCGGNQLTELDLSNVPGLTKLRCGDNQLTELDLSNVSGLRRIECEGNQLTELDLSNVPGLTELRCSRNQLTELDLSNVPGLTELLCYENQLTELDLSNLPGLIELVCSENQLTELDLSNLPELTELGCGSNHLTELDLSNVPGIEAENIYADPGVKIVRRRTRTRTRTR